MDPMHFFPKVTLLITHYNRSASLANLLSAFESLGVQFGEVVIADDGSRPEHLQPVMALCSQPSRRLVTSPVNRGLGHNINQGQRAVRTEYTLYVQEDYIPMPIFPEHFTKALSFMEADPSLDIVRMYAYFHYPKLKPFQSGFSTMHFDPLGMDHLKFYYYSDHPHLRRSTFLDKFGPYTEGASGDATEFNMALRFLKKKGTGLFFNEFSTLFDHVNTDNEPSTMQRASWRQKKHPAILLLRLIYLRYRWLKNTLQLLLLKI
jgi:glycosyltransferase involved in cell wall biosynthesis